MPATFLGLARSFLVRPPLPVPVYQLSAAVRGTFHFAIFNAEGRLPLISPTTLIVAQMSTYAGVSRRHAAVAGAPGSFTGEVRFLSDHNGSYLKC